MIHRSRKNYCNANLLEMAHKWLFYNLNEMAIKETVSWDFYLHFFFKLPFRSYWKFWFMVVLPTCGLSTTRMVQHRWTTLRIVHCNVYPPERIDHHFSNGLTTESHRFFRLISGGQTVSPQWTPGKVNKWSKYSKKCLKRDSNSRPPGHQSPMLTILIYCKEKQRNKNNTNATRQRVK